MLKHNRSFSLFVGLSQGLGTENLTGHFVPERVKSLFTVTRTVIGDVAIGTGLIEHSKDF